MKWFILLVALLGGVVTFVVLQHRKDAQSASLVRVDERAVSKVLDEVVKTSPPFKPWTSAITAPQEQEMLSSNDVYQADMNNRAWLNEELGFDMEEFLRRYDAATPRERDLMLKRLQLRSR